MRIERKVNIQVEATQFGFKCDGCGVEELGTVLTPSKFERPQKIYLKFLEDGQEHPFYRKENAWGAALNKELCHNCINNIMLILNKNKTSADKCIKCTRDLVEWMDGKGAAVCKSCH